MCVKSHLSYLINHQLQHSSVHNESLVTAEKSLRERFGAGMGGHAGLLPEHGAFKQMDEQERKTEAEFAKLFEQTQMLDQFLFLRTQKLVDTNNAAISGFKTLPTKDEEATTDAAALVEINVNMKGGSVCRRGEHHQPAQVQDKPSLARATTAPQVWENH